jgi:YYY domain-containing protein
MIEPETDLAWDFSDYRSWGRPPLVAQEQPSRLSPAAQTGIDALEIDVSTGQTEHPMYRKRTRGPNGRQAYAPAPAAMDTAAADTIPWQQGIGWALLAPLFVAVIGNLDGFAQIVRKLIDLSQSDFQSAIPGVATLVHAVSGFWLLLTTDARLPAYDFWGPSRVIGSEIQATINEFPYWSFTFADLHPHMIGIPFSVLFLGLVLTVLLNYAADWRKAWGYGALLLGAFSLLLGTLASINLWELPTYYGLGVLALAVALFRGRGQIDWRLLIGFAILYLAGAYLLFWPFFANYENIGASGVGLVRGPDRLGQWLLIWGFFLFVLVGWLVFTVTRPARPGDAHPTGPERWLSLIWRLGDRLPRFFHLHRLLVRNPSIWYLLGQYLIPLLLLVAAILLWRQWTILALCLPLLGLAFLLLWRRAQAADAGNLFVALLVTTGFALLAGTQIFFLRDFLQGGDHYRMNTLFKFFIQVWVLWGVAAAIGVAHIFGAGTPSQSAVHTPPSPFSAFGRKVWTAGFVVLFAVSLAYPIFGTPARLDQRFPGWRPEIGTLDGLAFMRQGVYTLDPGSPYDHLPEIPIELHYDWEAIQWILQNIRGNLIIAESSETDYYRAGGTRIASMTGLSGLNGKHAGEQRYGDVVGERSARFGELWNTPDSGRTAQLIDELDIDLIYVGQIERHLHPGGVETMALLAQQGVLTPIYENDRVTVYAVNGRVMQTADGFYYPIPQV